MNSPVKPKTCIIFLLCFKNKEVIKSLTTWVTEVTGSKERNIIITTWADYVHKRVYSFEREFLRDSSSPWFWQKHWFHVTFCWWISFLHAMQFPRTMLIILLTWHYSRYKQWRVWHETRHMWNLYLIMLFISNGGWPKLP